MKIRNLVPALAAFAVAPFVFAADDGDKTVPAAELAPAKPVQVSPEQRQLFLSGLGWLVGQQSGLIQDLRVSAEDVPAIVEGFRLALLGEGKDFPEKIRGMNEAYSAFIGELQTAAMEKAAAEVKAAADENRKLGAEFVAKTLEEDKGFSALPSGVLVKIVSAGDPAKKPTAADTVAVRYTGKLIDGTIFDSSARDEETAPVQFVAGEGETAELPLGGLIKAWGEALPLIGVGGSCTLVVPADSAYGDRGIGIIPPGSTLVFDIELADIVPADADDEDAADDDGDKAAVAYRPAVADKAAVADEDDGSDDE